MSRMDPKHELAALAERATALRATIDKLEGELQAIRGAEQEVRARLGVLDELDRAADRITPFEPDRDDAKTTVDSFLPAPLPAPPPSPAATPSIRIPAHQVALLRAGAIGAGLMLGLALVTLLAVDLVVRRSGREEHASTTATAAPPTAVLPIPTAAPEPPPRDVIPDPPPPSSGSLASASPRDLAAPSASEATPPPPSLSSAVLPVTPRTDVPPTAPKTARPGARDYGF